MAVDKRERELARIQTALNEMFGNIMDTFLSYIRIEEKISIGPPPHEGNWLTRKLYHADKTGNLWGLIEGRPWGYGPRTQKVYRAVVDMLLSLDDPENPFHHLERLSPKTATGTIVFACSRYCQELNGLAKSWTTGKNSGTASAGQTTEELFSFFNRPLPLPADPELVTILTEVITIQRLISRAHLLVSVYATAKSAVAPFAAKEKKRINNSRKTKKDMSANLLAQIKTAMADHAKVGDNATLKFKIYGLSEDICRKVGVRSNTVANHLKNRVKHSGEQQKNSYLLEELINLCNN